MTGLSASSRILVTTRLHLADLQTPTGNPLLRLLVRRGLWRIDGEDKVEEPPESLLPFLAAASIQGRSALEAGRPPERFAFGQGRERKQQATPLCAAVDGFSLHAAVRVEASDRERLERLCRYVTRPPLATERLSLAPDGKVTYRLRHVWRDGTTHVVFSPLAFIERLAALVPHPHEHLLTYHGALSPAADAGHLIVPTRRQEASREPPPAPERISSQSGRYRWAELLRRVFAIDVLRCEHCGGKRRLLALIQDPFVVRRILARLGLPSAPPPIAPARDPPQAELAVT